MGNAGSAVVLCMTCLYEGFTFLGNHLMRRQGRATTPPTVTEQSSPPASTT